MERRHDDVQPAVIGQPRSLADALLLLRTQTRMTREQAGEAAGVEARTISRYESDDAVRHDATTLRRLIVAYATALGTGTDQLWAELGRAIDSYMTAAEILDTQIDVMRGDRERRR